jgi:formylglycine-generating enzyme required for sulfatase activity
MGKMRKGNMFILLLLFLTGAVFGQTALANFVYVEGGTFQMGNNNSESYSKPVHTVTVKSFSMGKYEVTQKEWQEIMGSNPSNFKGETLPVESISWYEVIEYCNKRSIKEGLTPAYKGSDDNITCDWNANGYRLPTEAEWEFAAKGGIKDSYLTYEYSGGNALDAVAWYDGNSGDRTHPVGTKAPNSLGIYDMSGNVFEWCWDWYGDYSSRSQTDPRGPVTGTIRVLRGGCWSNIGQSLRSALRFGGNPSYRGYSLGFRLVRS